MLKTQALPGTPVNQLNFSHAKENRNLRLHPEVSSISRSLCAEGGHHKTFDYHRTCWNRWRGGHRTLNPLQGFNLRTPKKEPTRNFGCRTSWDGRVGPGVTNTASQLGRFFHKTKPNSEQEQQTVAVVNVHLRLSLSEPSNLLGLVGKRLFREFQPRMLEPSQDGGGFFGGGNRNGNVVHLLSYGGDDGSNEEYSTARSKKKRLLMYRWWVVSLVVAWGLVWALGAYSGLARPTQITVSQFVDCLLWIGLMWCSATFLLWAARMVALVGAKKLSPRRGLRFFSSKNTFTSWSEFLVGGKADVHMAQNLVAVPGLVVTLFLLSDLVHYGKTLSLVSLNAVYGLVKIKGDDFVGKVRRSTMKLNKGSAFEKRQRRELTSSRRKRT